MYFRCKYGNCHKRQVDHTESVDPLCAEHFKRFISNECMYINCKEQASEFAPYGRLKCAGLCTRHYKLLAPTTGNRILCFHCGKIFESSNTKHCCETCEWKHIYDVFYVKNKH